MVRNYSMFFLLLSVSCLCCFPTGCGGAEPADLEKQITGVVNRDIELTRALFEFIPNPCPANGNTFEEGISFFQKNLEDRKEILYGLSALKNTVKSDDLDAAVSFLKLENNYVQLTIKYFEAEQFAQHEGTLRMMKGTNTSNSNPREFEKVKDEMRNSQNARELSVEAFAQVEKAESSMVKWNWPMFFTNKK